MDENQNKNVTPLKLLATALLVIGSVPKTRSFWAYESNELDILISHPEGRALAWRY
uniref:Uncharacterized protein n=1 Tax=Utricularia reniformis TaxID=192314 RepID=A0A1Y0AZX1_9LAMI|nr:hypothetical protein AEK19_MT0420 [Utricularia reniformis]ART30684.1 hypothetical protein AEK19_MT0420 [Utricularia reniformis]